VKPLAIVVSAALAVFSVLAIALEPDFRFTAVLNLGFVDVYPFDIVFVAVVFCLLASGAFHFRHERCAGNRAVIWLIVAYVAYQLLVVLPVAVVVHDLRLIDVLKLQESRLAILFIPFFYSVALRYWRPATVIAVFDVAAATLALWVLIRYALDGGQGYWDGDLYRLRAVWGGASLVFAWLLFTSLFYWPLRLWRLPVAALALGALVLANHRSGILALLSALVVQLLAMRGNLKRLVAVVAVVAVVGVGVYAASPFVRSSVAYSLRTLVNPSADVNATDRVTRSVLGLQYFSQHPLGDYIWSQRYYLVSFGERDFAPHNMVVQLLVTQGVVATLLFLALIAVSMWISWRNRAHRLSAVMLSYLVFYVVFCLFNTNIESPENYAFFAVCIGLILHDNRRSAEELATPTPDDAEAGEPPGATSASRPSTVASLMNASCR